MNGQLVIESFGIFDNGSLSSAVSTRHIHGSWFDDMDEVNDRIKEESLADDFKKAWWESWD